MATQATQPLVDCPADLRVVDDAHVAVHGRTYDCADFTQAAIDADLTLECEASVARSGSQGLACIRRFVELGPARPVTVPVVPAPASDAPARCTLTFEIQDERTALLDGAVVHIRDVGPTFDAHCAPEFVRVAILARATGTYQAVVAWIDALRRSGISRFAINTRPPR